MDGIFRTLAVRVLSFPFSIVKERRYQCEKMRVNTRGSVFNENVVTIVRLFFLSHCLENDDIRVENGDFLWIAPLTTTC